MARLIKADDLKVEIANYFLSCVDKGKIVIDITEMQVELYKIINSQPTAYDVEKVVECLEEKVELAHKRYVDCPVNSHCYERYRTQYNERRMCLDIVEGGGVNDD